MLTAETDATGLRSIGRWTSDSITPAFDHLQLLDAVARCREAAFIVRESDAGRVGVALDGNFSPSTEGGLPCLGILPALYPEWLGDRSFLEVHGLRFPYVTGAMARGIATTSIVIEMGNNGMLGFFGSAGLPLPVVERALDEIEQALGNKPWGCNLIHSPQEPQLEEGMAELLLRRGVRRVSASAYMALTPSIVRYAMCGLRTAPDGQIMRNNYVFAKISRPETAAHFMSPPPGEMLDALVERQWLTPQEAQLARHLPVAEDITTEADSGGHTDNQILTALFSTITSLRDRIAAKHGYTRPIRIGAAGGLGTPSAVAGAFALGAAYVLTGSVNQSAVESGVSTDAKALLAETRMGDVMMAPSADMFELGVKVQVLKRGTMFGPRAQQLYDLYAAYPSLEAIPSDVMARLEKQLFRAPIAEIWEGTRAFWAERNPREAERADKDPKHKMALVFRWYVGSTSRWPITGTTERKIDYQLWCGPAMGAFNAWVADSFLEPPQNRTVVQIARNLLEGAAVITRAQQLRNYGVPLPPQAFEFRPRELA